MDDETRARFDAQDAVLQELLGRSKQQDLQLAAIVTRLDEVDASHDRLMSKMDRLAIRVDQLSVLARSGEEAMNSLDALSRRVAKIEAAMRGKEE